MTDEAPEGATEGPIARPDPSGVTCVLFDLYGTLLDIRLNEDRPALWAGLAAVLTSCGGRVARPEDVRHRFRQILKEEGERGREGFLMEPVFRRLLAWAGARDDVAPVGDTFRELSLETLAIRPYAAPLFEALRRTSCAVGIVSNTEALLTRFDLARWPLLRSADTVVLSSEVGVRKPDPAIFRIALDRLRAAPASAVVVGNSLTEDIDGARRAGLRAIYLDAAARGVDRLDDGTPAALRVESAYDALVRGLQTLGWRVS